MNADDIFKEDPEQLQKFPWQKAVIWLFATLFLVCGAYAVQQSMRIDSLKSIIEKEKADKGEFQKAVYAKSQKDIDSRDVKIDSLQRKINTMQERTINEQREANKELLEKLNISNNRSIITIKPRR